MATKCNDMVDTLRKQILSGAWKPSHRLPTRDELLEQYGASRGTLQKAIDQLTQEGFIVSCGKSGTFVAAAPPNLNTIAIVFPADGSRSQAWDAMWSRFVAQKSFFEKRFGRKLSFYYLEQEKPVCDEYRQLVEDAANGRLAGVIFPYTPAVNLVADLARHQVKIVGITGQTDIPGLIPVWLDYGSFLAKSLDFMAEKHRRRVAMLTNVQLPLDYLDDFKREAGKRQIATDDLWIQGTGLDSFSSFWTVKLVRLMMRGDPDERPDGLIVANENLLDLALEALHREKLVPGHDLDLASQVNFPSERNGYHAIERVGFDIRSMVECCLAALAADKARPMTRFGLIPALREKELQD